ncbi:Leucine_rich repeat-containing protein [Hexamita inflata]|uniref:Leucine rich repeat-containing protein n=1 Tax=Hexamita inflata TaxID=28002 RepID=A0AA86Q7S6_9EUKA|nr:Leucine rich repeat-containing protein [Hexamita inflata]
MTEQTSSHEHEMSAKYANHIKNKKLIIKNDELLTDLRFVANFKIVNLEINNCFNVKISNINNVLSLTLNNCGLINIVGIETLELLFVDLRENEIIFIEPLKNICTLKHVLIDDNCIVDLEALVDMPNFNPGWIQEQKPLTDVIIGKYLNQTQQKQSIEQFKATIHDKQLKSELLLDKYPRKYDAEITAKYFDKIRDDGYGRGIYIYEFDGDSFIYDLKPFQKFNLECLFLSKCQNVNLLRVPQNLTVLIIEHCKMKSIKGIERANSLEKIFMYGNNFINIQYLKELPCVIYLDISNNKIEDFTVIEYNQIYGQYSEGLHINDQREAMEDEVEEAMLW